MARPKYAAGDTTAKDNLIEAFWKALEEQPFEKITVKQVAGYAGVNKNTFYYHFETMEDLAREAIRRIPLDNLPLHLLFDGGNYLSELGILAESDKLDKLFKRGPLVCGRNGQAIVHLLDETIMQVLCEYGGIKENQLSSEERMTLRLLAVGLKANLQSSGNTANLKKTVKMVTRSPIAEVVIAEVRKISKRHQGLPDD